MPDGALVDIRCKQMRNHQASRGVGIAIIAVPPRVFRRSGIQGGLGTPCATVSKKRYRMILLQNQGAV